MESSEAVFKEPKYALSNASTVGDIPLGEIPLPEGLPIPEGGFKALQQPKFALSNASMVGSPFPGSGFKVEVESAVSSPPRPVTEQPFPEGGPAGWATALGAYVVIISQRSFSKSDFQSMSQVFNSVLWLWACVFSPSLLRLILIMCYKDTRLHMACSKVGTIAVYLSIDAYMCDTIQTSMSENI